MFVVVGASMSQGFGIGSLALGIAALCTFGVSGCAAPMQMPHRFHDPELAKTLSGPVPITGGRFGMQDLSECTSCDDRQRLQDCVHVAMPYVAGPFMHHDSPQAYEPQQATIKPPHSKFHPVPTRPVFETRSTYHFPEPMGVQLVPVPEIGSRSLPHLHQPDSLYHTPPNPPLDSIDSLSDSEFENSETFMLSPPSN